MKVYVVYSKNTSSKERTLHHHENVKVYETFESAYNYIKHNCDEMLYMSKSIDTWTYGVILDANTVTYVCIKECKVEK